ncbi:MAG: malonate transporter subunit MadM [Bacteroidota bacterium]
METVYALIAKNGLVFAFLFVGIIMWLSYWLAAKLTHNKVSGAAIAITAGLVMAYFGGEKGIASFPLFAGVAVLGGSMFRDFAIVATAMGASFTEIKKAGVAGILSLFIGIGVAFTFGAITASLMGYVDVKSMTTIGAGACTYIVGPVTGAAIGASSDVIAISIATGVIKSVVTAILTPFIAPKIGLDNPNTAMVFGGMIGTTSGVAAGLAATDPKLVPYGALTATFYTGLGVLLCPSILYYLTSLLMGS